MGALFVFIFILAAWDVTKSAVKAQAGDYRASKGQAGGKAAGKSAAKGSRIRSPLGYWAREAVRGFPVARTTWHAGWLAHKSAAAQTRSARENARTEHLETRASFLKDVREHEQRRAAAQDSILKSLAGSGEPVKGRKAVREAAANLLPSKPADSAVPPLPADTVKPAGSPAGKPGTSDPQAARPPAQPAADPRGPMTGASRDQAVALAHAREESRDGRPRTVYENDGHGNSRPAVTYINGEEAPQGRHAKTQPQPQEKGDGSQSQGPGTPQPQPQQEGSRMASDVSYHQVLQDTQRAVARSDQNNATIQQEAKQAYQLADQMTAANVDPAVISEQMNHASALDRAAQELAKAGEHATNTSGMATRYHGQMQEAHDDAPGKVADKEFHQS